MKDNDFAEHGPVRVGLTGGIASGKSTVADLFAAMGAEVIDADQIAHALVEPGQPALAEIAAAFGDGVIGSDGSLDRRKLREIIYGSPQERERLESILHPRIFAELDARAGSVEGPYVILVIPLLAETGAADRLDRILVVDCEESDQIDRLVARDAISEASARKILNAQAGREDRLRLANDVLLNQVPVEDLEGLVLKLHRLYRGFADPRDARTRPGLRLP